MDYSDTAYNRRLFRSSAIRRVLHERRFHWVSDCVSLFQLASPSIIELGCFDAKLLRFLRVTPRYYLGLDANWEGGLDAARRAFASTPTIELRLCQRPEDIPADREFDIGICMETLEHVPPESMPQYIERLANAVQNFLVVTIPVERGLPFLMKRAAKKLLRISDERYSVQDIFWSALGRLDQVQRLEHKGFDDRLVVQELRRHFANVRSYSLIPPAMPRSLSLGLGIIASDRLSPSTGRVS